MTGIFDAQDSSRNGFGLSALRFRHAGPGSDGRDAWRLHRVFRRPLRRRLGANRNRREFQLETEIVVKADGKADNGLLYGAKIELQNSTPNAGTGVGTDEASIYVGGHGAVSNWAISTAPPIP